MLFRGGLREADVLLAEFEAVGLGVEDILMAESSGDISPIFSFDISDMVKNFISKSYLPVSKVSLSCTSRYNCDLCRSKE